MRSSLRQHEAPVDGQLVENPSAAGAAVGVVGDAPTVVQAGDVQVIPPTTAVQVVLTNKHDDKRLHAEAANRRRTATRPAMGPGAEAAFEPTPGKITAGFGDTYSVAKDKALFIEVRKRGLRNPGNLTTYDPQYYKSRKGGSKRARQEMIGTLIRSDNGELRPSDLPGEADVGGDGMEYVSHGAMVCSGIITVIGVV